MYSNFTSNPEASQHKVATLRRPRLILFDLYAMFVVIVVLSSTYLNIPSYVFVLEDNFFPKYFYYGFFVLIAPLLLLRFKAFVLYLTSPFFLWAIAVVILNAIHLYFARIDNDMIRADIIDTRIQYLVETILIGFAVSVTRTTLYERIFLVLAMIIPCAVILDFLKPGMFYPAEVSGAVMGRAAAMFINPNAAGDAMLLALIFAIALIRPKHQVSLLLMVGAGVFLTFSRGAILAWMLIWVFLLVIRAVSKYTLIFPIAVFVALPLLMNIFAGYLDQRDDLAGGLKNIIARLDFFHTRSLEDNSAQARIEVLRAGGNLFLSNPVFGAGGGATFTWAETVSTHNQLILLAAEYGVFGILLWFWLAMILWKGKYFQDRRFQLVFVLGFIFLSLFTHMMLDSFHWLVTFAIISGRRRIQRS